MGVWVGVIVSGCKLQFIIMSVLFWPYGLLDIRWAVFGAILACFVLASLCRLALWGDLWGTCLCPALKTSGGGYFNVSGIYV